MFELKPGVYEPGTYGRVDIQGYYLPIVFLHDRTDCDGCYFVRMFFSMATENVRKVCTMPYMKEFCSYGNIPIAAVSDSPTGEYCPGKVFIFTDDPRHYYIPVNNHGRMC